MQHTRGRFVVGLIALALIAACNDDVMDEGNNPIPTAENVLSLSPAAKPLELVVEAPDEAAKGEAVPLKMVLRNTGEAPIQVEIDQHGGTLKPVYNFFVFGQDMDIVRLRLPVIVAVGAPSQTLGPGDTLQFEWTWDQRDQDGEAVEPGTYQVIGTLGVDANDDIRTEPVSVTIR